MNRVAAWLQAAWKAMSLHFPGPRWGWQSVALGGPAYAYQALTTQSRLNAVVTAVIRWICRTFPEAPLETQTIDADGDWATVPEHPLTALLQRPNGYYSGLQLWCGTLADYLTHGNAYWYKVRSAAGRVVELWWLPAAYVEPKWPVDGSPPFIRDYQYTVDGDLQVLPPADVIHFRDGFDPQNIRKGLSPLASLLREVATDDEASQFTAAMLRNLGVPGVVISPGPGISPTDFELQDIKEKFAQRFGGESRGQPLVLRGPATVSVLSFSPEQMQLRDHRRIPEERITAIYGTPAVVVGLGAGLDRSTFANFAEAREAAYESTIIPLQRIFLADLQLGLVPEFGDPRTLRLAFDYDDVRVLQADHNALMERAVRGFKGGILTRAEARVLVGQEPEDADDVFSISSTETLQARDVLPPEPVVAPPPPEPVDTGVPTDELIPAAAAWTGATKVAAAVGVFSPAQLAEAAQLWAAVAEDSGLEGLLGPVRPPNGHA